jgi:hypothetical protein
MADLKIEPGKIKTTACECCGRESRTVYGFVYRGDDAAAAYFVQWTLGGVASHGANFDLILGRWGEGATSADRCAVSLEFRRTDHGPTFTVIDAAVRPVAQSDLVDKTLTREEVIGTPTAKIAFDIVDAVWIQDDRIQEIVGGALV